MINNTFYFDIYYDNVSVDITATISIDKYNITSREVTSLDGGIVFNTGDLFHDYNIQLLDGDIVTVKGVYIKTDNTIAIINKKYIYDGNDPYLGIINITEIIDNSITINENKLIGTNEYTISRVNNSYNTIFYKLTYEDRIVNTNALTSDTIILLETIKTIDEVLTITYNIPGHYKLSAYMINDYNDISNIDELYITISDTNATISDTNIINYIEWE